MFITDSDVWFEMTDEFCEGTVETNAAVRKSLVEKFNWGERIQWCRDADMAYLAM